MYKISKNLKTLSFVLMAVGILSLAFGFLTTPSSVEDVKAEMVEHHVEADHHEGDEHNAVVKDNDHYNDAHAEHVYTQMNNRPWSALYVSALFFFFLALGVMAFMAIQYVAQAGWSVVLLRVMEAISSYMIVGGIILFLILVAGGFHFHHVFHWMDASLVDPTSPNYDEIIDGKSGYLNVPFFLARVAVYLGGWILALKLLMKYSLEQENAIGDRTPYNNAFKVAAIFMVFYGVTSSTGAWDLVMSVDPHWFSTLFGWYVFAGMFVSGIATIALVTLYLKSQGYLEFVNSSHIHDLGKFMFGMSIFWTYLWFSQFMLYWYADIPEEVTYYLARFADYKIPFWIMVGVNFAFPVLILMDSAKKSKPVVMAIAGIAIIFGHYLDVFVMIMPGSVGSHWGFGVVEIGTFLGFLGLFIFIVFTALEKRGLLAKGHPMLKESEYHHYYNIEHDDH